MADILDVLIQVLNIDCGVAQCYYANPMEGLFYLFFFPTIFIILFIYILTNFIFRGSGKIQGLRILIAVGAYAFIIFERLFTMVVGLSRLWWILTIILVGLYAFIRFLFKGGEEGSKGKMPGIGGLRGGSIADRMKGKFHDQFLKKSGLENDDEKIKRKSQEEIQRVMDKHSKKGWEGLSDEEKAVYLAAHGLTAKDKNDFDKLYKSLEKD
ncbi:hypothetical protein ACFLQO_00125 [Candidatus Aenigmatarchaeota archaeon]